MLQILSKFSKNREKPTIKPKEGVIMVSNGGAIFKLGPIFEEEGQRMVTLIELPPELFRWTIEHEGQYIEVYPHYAVRDVVKNVRNGTWKIVKEGPIEPEKILKQFNFI